MPHQLLLRLTTLLRPELISQDLFTFQLWAYRHRTLTRTNYEKIIPATTGAISVFLNKILQKNIQLLLVAMLVGFANV